MSKLDPMLQHALSAWRTEVGYARSGQGSRHSLEDLEARRVSVVVTYSGDPSPLRAAGLQTGFDSGGTVSGLIALRDVERLAAVATVVSIAMEPPVKLGLDGTVKEMRVPWKVPPTDPWPGRGAGVIVAVIDTGIDIFHDSFRRADGTTRILELWDQSATTGGSAPPAPFTLGRVYSAQNINDGLAAGAPFHSIDDNGHGTHVAGIAAGNGRQDDRCSFPGRYVGVAPEADLVIVKAIDIPTASIRDAFRWCAQAGTRLPGNKPVVINCSFGSDLGPHDGTGTMDGWVDDILRPAAGPPAGLAIVVLAGNSGRGGVHESGAVPANGTVTLSFYVPDGSRRADHLDIWYNGTATLDMELIAPPNPSLPGSNRIGPVPPGAPGSPFTIGRMSIDVTSSIGVIAANSKKRILVSITPPADAPVRPGTWQLTLTERSGTAASWDAWLDTELGDAHPTWALPSEGTPPVRRREHTIWEPGTSRNAITVASYDDGNGRLADSSSRGPANQPAGMPVGEFKPTVAAPGVGVAAPRSRNDPDENSSCCDQKVIDKQGTSMATPHVAGLVALMFEKNRTLNFEQVRAHLQHAARIDGIPSAEVPPIFDAAMNIRAHHLWGSGKVDAAVTLAEMPAAVGGGGGGGGGGPVPFVVTELGYTPHNLVSRLGDWQSRFGPRPGLMLVAALLSEHVDEVLRLVNRNRRVGAVWQRGGGPLLVRRLLHGPPPQELLFPQCIDGCDSAGLIARLLPLLDRFGGPRLKADLARFGEFAELWPGADLARLDEAALQLATPV